MFIVRCFSGEQCGPWIFLFLKSCVVYLNIICPFLQQISKESRNGIITKYRIIKEINGTRSPPDFIKNPSAVGYQVSVNNEQSTRILLNVATEVGFSAKHDSSLIVPPLHLSKWWCYESFSAYFDHEITVFIHLQILLQWIDDFQFCLLLMLPFMILSF